MYYSYFCGCLLYFEEDDNLMNIGMCCWASFWTLECHPSALLFVWLLSRKKQSTYSEIVTINQSVLEVQEDIMSIINTEASPCKHLHATLMNIGGTKAKALTELMKHLSSSSYTVVIVWGSAPFSKNPMDSGRGTLGNEKIRTAVRPVLSL